MFYIAIVGRPNVGKSTLFNKIAGVRAAIVDDTPGVTRDRNIAVVERKGRRFGVLDSGGFEPASKDEILTQVREQALMAVEESELIFLMVDGREGVTPVDEEIAHNLRRSGKPVWLVVNKVDSAGQRFGAHDFARLGFDDVYSISAEHSLGIDELIENAATLFPEKEHAPTEGPEVSGPVRVAVVGKPNVGKSSLVNRLLGYDRMMVSEIAGTTRDSIDTDLTSGGKHYTLIDTAGIRRKARVSRKLEKFSVIMAMKAIDRADVALLMIDAADGVAAQEAKIGGLIDEYGKACVIVVNKWDIVDKDDKTTRVYEEAIRRQLKFLDHAPIVFVSAVTGQRMGRIWKAVDDVYGQYSMRLGSGRLNALIERVVGRRPPPTLRSRRVKIYYATQVAVRPPTFVFMTNAPYGVHFSYRRYIANQIRENAGFDQAPLRLIFRKPAGRRVGAAGALKRRRMRRPHA